jgi:hypothetical protein
MIDLFNGGFVLLALCFVALQGERIHYLERQVVELRGRPAGPNEFRLGAVLRVLTLIIFGLAAVYGAYLPWVS